MASQTLTSALDSISEDEDSGALDELLDLTLLLETSLLEDSVFLLEELDLIWPTVSNQWSPSHS